MLIESDFWSKAIATFFLVRITVFLVPMNLVTILQSMSIITPIWTRLDSDRTWSLIRHSMPEMGWTEAERYVEWIAKNCNDVFLSFNQETHSLNGDTGEPQASVAEITKSLPNISRWERNYSWDRRVYLEETFVVSQLERS